MSLIIFLLVLSILVLVHECGHFLVARLFGIKADEFGYGFPPRLIGFVKDDHGKWKRVGRRDTKTYKNTIWSINWLPFGGFVRIKGEQGEGQRDADAFHNHPMYQRFLVLIAGVFMNALLAALLFSVVFMIGTRTSLVDLPTGAHIEDRSIRITNILPDSPAAQAGLKENDAVVSLDGRVPETYEQVREWIQAAGERPLTLRVQREGAEQDISVTPIFLKDVGRTGVGIGLADIGYVSLSPLRAFQAGVLVTAAYMKAVLFTLGDLVKGIFVHNGVTQDVTGPVGIAVIAGQVAREGASPLLQFMAILSVNLAVINILPIPALDGGRILFLLIEKLRRRSMSRILEAAIHNVAFLVLILLIIVVTIHDVSRYGTEIIGGVRGIIGM